ARQIFWHFSFAGGGGCAASSGCEGAVRAAGCRTPTIRVRRRGARGESVARLHQYRAGVRKSCAPVARGGRLRFRAPACRALKSSMQSPNFSLMVLVPERPLFQRPIDSTLQKG